jgi:hypothetical protein
MDKLERPDEKELPASEIISLDKEHVRGRAVISKSSENGEEYWMLQGKSYCFNNLAITTICYGDPADKAWAIETFRSIMHPSPK